MLPEITAAEAAVMLFELSEKIAQIVARHRASHQGYSAGTPCPCRTEIDALKAPFRDWFGAMGAARVEEPETCEAGFACARYTIWGLERYVAYALDQAAPGGDAVAKGRACAALYPTSELRIDIAALAKAQLRFESLGHTKCGAPENASASHGWPEW